MKCFCAAAFLSVSMAFSANAETNQRLTNETFTSFEQSIDFSHIKNERAKSKMFGIVNELAAYSENELSAIADMMISKIQLESAKVQEPLAPHQTLVLQTALKALGHYDGVLNGIWDSTTTEMTQDYYHTLPLTENDNKIISDFVGEHVPIVLDEGIIKPDTSNIENLIFQALTDAYSDKHLSRVTDMSNLDPNMLAQLDLLAAQLTNSYKTISLSNEALMDEDPTSFSSDYVQIMMPPHEGGKQLKTRMEERLKWELVRDTIEDNGTQTEVISSTDSIGEIKETFTRDQSLVIGNVAYIPDPQEFDDTILDGKQIDTYRKAIEQKARIHESRGMDTVFVEGAWFEGGNIVIHTTDNGDNVLFMGLESRSNEHSLDKLIDKINQTQSDSFKGVPVDLDDLESYYHLDLIMSPQLSNGHHFIYEDGMTEASYNLVVEHIGGDNLIPVDGVTASTYALNMIQVNGDSLLPTASSKQLEKLATEHGYNIINPKEFGIDTFEYRRGGVHCITLEAPLTMKH